MKTIDEKIDRYLNENISEAIDSRFNPLRGQLKAAQKRAEEAFKETVSKTLNAMDEYAENTCMEIYKDDPVGQKRCFQTFYAKLIVFVQDQLLQYISEDLVSELVSEMDEHAKFIKKKYGWYVK